MNTSLLDSNVLNARVGENKIKKMFNKVLGRTQGELETPTPTPEEDEPKKALIHSVYVTTLHQYVLLISEN